MSAMDLQHRATGPAGQIMSSLVPWLCVLAVSTSLAYAMTVALGGGPSSAPKAQGDVSSALVPVELSTPTAYFLDDDGGLVCGGAGCGRWLPITVDPCDTPVKAIDKLIGATGRNACTPTVVW